MDEDLRARYRINRPYNRESTTRPVQRQAPAQPVAARPAAASAEHHRLSSSQSAQESVLPEPARPLSHSEQPSHPSGPARYKHRRRRVINKRLAAIFLLLIILAAVAGGIWRWRTAQQSPIPAATRNSVSFPLPYPTKLPSGYHIDEASFTSSRSVVIYTAVSQSASKIIFTTQQRPTNFDFSAFYKSGLTNSTVFTAPAGQAAIGGSEGHLLGSLVTDKAWLLVSPSGNGLQAGDLRLILNGIKISDH